MKENLETYHYDKIYEYFSKQFLNNDIFYILCERGMINLVQIFLQLKDIDIKYKTIFAILIFILFMTKNEWNS